MTDYLKNLGTLPNRNVYGHSSFLRKFQCTVAYSDTVHWENHKAFYKYQNLYICQQCLQCTKWLYKYTNKLRYLETTKSRPHLFSNFDAIGVFLKPHLYGDKDM